MRALARPMTHAFPPRVVVVGGGVTGLTAAYDVHRVRPDVELSLFEAAPTLGGNIRTEREQGFVVDTGPDSFVITKPDALVLCRELGVESELTPTESAARHVYFAHEGRLELMPGGMALAVPTRIGPLLKTPIVGALGRLRMLLEPFVPARRAGGDESIESFLSRRLGAAGARSLAGPLLGGIYAGDIGELGIDATFPQLVDLEKKYGSLVRGFLALELARGGGTPVRPGIGSVIRWLRRTGVAEAASPFRAMKGGMGTLIETLAGFLPSGAVRTSTAVTAIERAEGGGFRVVTREGATFADAVVLASPAHAAARLVPDAELAQELRRIPYVSTATVFFGFDRGEVAHSLEGFGFIVPPGEGNLLAGTWVSSKWSGRAAPGTVLVRAFVGGARDPGRVTGSSDAELLAFAKAELVRLMGPLGTPRFARVYRYENGSPQPLVGHLELVRRLRERCAARLPGLFLAGAAYDGVGIPDCVRQARAAARDVIAALPAQAAAGAVG